MWGIILLSILAVQIPVSVSLSSKKENLELLLSEIDKLNIAKLVFLKLSPDLTPHQVDEILETSFHHNIQGFVCTNLTKNRNNEKTIKKDLPPTGGISGKVVSELSNNLIKYV